MEEAYPWAEQMLKLLDNTDARGRSAYDLLAAALPHLESPSASRAGGACLIALMEGKLEDASSDLTSTLACMDATGLLDRRSGYHSPASSFAAFREVQEARVHGEDALRATDRCRGHLGAARPLLGHPGVPSAHGCVKAERVAAVRALDAVLGSVRGGGG